LVLRIISAFRHIFAETDDITKGLMARAHGTGIKPVDHVACEKLSQWILQLKIEMLRLIDMVKMEQLKLIYKVESEVVDLSKGIPGEPENSK